jgi:hypothetical protein
MVRAWLNASLLTVKESRAAFVGRQGCPASLRTMPPRPLPCHARRFTQPGFASVDLRVEVGLLSRNVVIQGDDASSSQL